MLSDYDEKIWEDPVYSRDERPFWVALGVLWGLGMGCLVTVLVLVLA